MSWIDLGNPSPRDVYEPYRPYEWPSGDIEPLPSPPDIALPSIDQVIEQRRSRRLFGQFDREKLSHFLWLTCRTTGVGNEQLGFPIRQRPAPSAGAIHPIHLVIAFEGGGWLRYDPDLHGLARLNMASDAANELWQSVAKVLDPGNGCVLLFVAEHGKTSAKYRNSDSLVWRDAGTLLGHMALVAESLELNFCPLGITGEPWISQLDGEGKLVGVGVALLGSRLAP